MTLRRNQPDIGADRPNMDAVYPLRKILHVLTGSIGLCYIFREGHWYPPPVFQYGVSGTAPDFLCMAGEIAPKPDRKQLDEVYPAVLILIQVEY